MKKANFVTLILSVAGVLFFAIGMCMCLITEWNAFTQGVIMGAIGVVLLIIMIIVRRKMQGKPAVVLNGKAIGTAIFGIFGALVLGVGMCMTMVWQNLMVPGIIVGIVGIILLLCLIPLCKKLK